MNLQHKNIALGIGFLVLLWISYHFAIANTLLLKKEYKKLSNEKILFSNVPQQLSNLKQQNTYYDSILKAKKISTSSSFQNNLLQIITSFSEKHQLKVASFNEPHSITKDNAKLNTYAFTVSGNFTSILQLIYELEQQYKFGILLSINFKKKKNYRRNQQYLECTILLQRIES